MFRVLFLCCLMGVAMAVPLEDQKKDTDLVSAASRTLTEVAEVVVETRLWQTLTIILLVGVTVYIVFLLIDDLSSGRRSFARSLTTGWDYEEGMLMSVLNSIDPVDMSFRFMEIENNACRKRTLCQLSAKPFIGQFIRYISLNIKSLVEFEDAMSAGEALQDCALLFAECPENQHFIKK